MSGDAAPARAGALSRRLVSGIVLHVAAVGILLAPAWFWLPLTLAGSWRLNHELAALLRVDDPQRLRRQSTLFGAGIITGTALDAGIPTVQALVLGLLIAMSAQAGDLAASLVKRDAGVKDAATLIPGHGGLLDRLNSLMFAGLVSYGYLIRVLP